jgi:hypothetical protein
VISIEITDSFIRLSSHIRILWVWTSCPAIVFCSWLLPWCILYQIFIRLFKLIFINWNASSMAAFLRYSTENIEERIVCWSLRGTRSLLSLTAVGCPIPSIVASSILCLMNHNWRKLITHTYTHIYMIHCWVRTQGKYVLIRNLDVNFTRCIFTFH